MADRPPFILVFAADAMGCGLHRCVIPLASLVHTGVANGRIEMGRWDDATVLACKPDVIVWQRQVEDDQIDLMQRWRILLPETLFIYELDDYLDEIPPASFHASFMPPDIRSRIVRALASCDRITTTTQPMADWLSSLAPELPVSVVPNALPLARLKEAKVRDSGKLRVGFAGGMSHSGDLELIRPAMREIGDKVTWVFFGAQIEDPPVDIEFHQGLPPTMYLDHLASLDLDLMLAPLEANKFNECKSNLRLVEAAAAGAAVIAQDMTAYWTNQPPVFAYATTPEDWSDAINRFVTASPSARQISTDLLRAWVARRYSLERVLQDRMNAWLPTAPSQHWEPSTSVTSSLKFLVTCQDDRILRTWLNWLGPQRIINSGLEDACRRGMETNSNVLWLRPSAYMPLEGIGILQNIVAQSPDCASAVPLASDGANSFPLLDRWVPLPPVVVDVVSDILDRDFNDVTLPIQAPTGPAIYLSVSALRMLGIPDVAGADGNEEQAILEWGLSASARSWRHIQAVSTFASSTDQPQMPTQKAVTRLQARGFGDLLQTKPDRVLTQDARQKIEIELLKAQWGGPRPGSMGFDNSYESWSTLRGVQQALIAQEESDPETWVCMQQSLGWAAEWANPHAWIVFTDDTITLVDSALLQFNVAIVGVDKNVMVVYADHETVMAGKRMPELKPDFDQTLLLAQDYVTPVCAIRASALAAAPLSRVDLFSTILGILLSYGSEAFVHLPCILGAMETDLSPETMARETLGRQQAIEQYFGNRVAVTPHTGLLGCLSVVWKTDDTPLVSIVIPTLGLGRLIEPCLKTILQHTNYKNYEIIVVQNGPRKEPEISNSVLMMNPHIRVVRYDGVFNWAAINNWAIKNHSKGSYIVTMNDDVMTASKDWLGAMLAHAVQRDVGVVGAKLVHPAGMLQHIGVVCHHGVAGHMHKGMANGSPGHMGRGLLSHEAFAVTGACMLFNKANYDAVDGFNEDFGSNYNDTIFCVQLHRQGKRNVVEMSAELLHAEASSRPPSNTPEGMPILIRDNARLVKMYSDVPDPYWNPNMQIQSSQGGLHLQGLNADMLAWADFKPHPDSVRVLLINDKQGPDGLILDCLHLDAVPFAADLSGFKLRLTAPTPMNIQPWDIRNAKALRQGLLSLGIRKIVLRSMVGAEGSAPPIETLRVLGSLRPDIEVEINALDPATMTPWLAVEVFEDDDEQFGYVDVETWKKAYADITAGQGGH